MSETDNPYEPPKVRNSPETDEEFLNESFWRPTVFAMMISVVVSGVSAVVTMVFLRSSWIVLGVKALPVAAMILVFVTNVVVTLFISARRFKRAMLGINVVNIASWTVFILSLHLSHLLPVNSPSIRQSDVLIISIIGLACAVISFIVTLVRWYLGPRR